MEGERIRSGGGAWIPVSNTSLSVQIPHIKVGPEETPRLQYLRFASVSLYPSNEDVSLAVSRILKSFNYPSASLICAKAECEGELSVLSAFLEAPLSKSPKVPQFPGPRRHLLVPAVSFPFRNWGVWFHRLYSLVPERPV